MKQTTKLTLSQKTRLSSKLSESLLLLSADNVELQKNLNDYALSNPMIEIVLPSRRRQQSSFINQAKSMPTSSLDMHLLNQLKFLPHNNEYKKAMYVIISALDENGFFKGDVSSIAAKTGFSSPEIEQMLDEIKTLDPPGIGSKDYIESILIQLNVKGLLTGSSKTIILEYLNELSCENFNAIKAATGTKASDSKKLLAEIRKLNPYPAKSFNSPEPILYVEPDIIITKSKDGLHVSLNKTVQYGVSINSNKEMRLNELLASEDLKYINNMYREANWLKKSLQKRYDTLLKCGRKIAELQESFFLYSKAVPLRKKDIADMLSMHPSTITRALKNKYIECDQGIYPAEFFFSGRSCFSGKYSPHQLKSFIKKIIDDENRLFPESDIKIAAFLHASGIDISRRTVAKYRADMGISPSSIRKETSFGASTILNS